MLEFHSFDKSLFDKLVEVFEIDKANIKPSGPDGHLYFIVDSKKNHMRVSNKISVGGGNTIEVSIYNKALNTAVINAQKKIKEKELTQ